MTSTVPAVSCRDLTVRVPGRTLVEALELELGSGEFLAVLGQNGAGKTQTLHTVAGLRGADSGTVKLAGEPLGRLTRRQIARHLALLPQYVDDVFPATVVETVLIGRHPHLGLLEQESDEDRRVALRSLQQVGLADFADRDIGTLSGGERRRVAIAQVLAQAPQVYLLDEPTNHLDPQHQLEVLELFAARAQHGSTVVASLHDVNLAARFATHCLLLHGDGRWELGRSATILDEARLSGLYGTRMEAVRWRNRNIFVATGERSASAT